MHIRHVFFMLLGTKRDCYIVRWHHLLYCMPTQFIMICENAEKNSLKTPSQKNIHVLPIFLHFLFRGRQDNLNFHLSCSVIRATKNSDNVSLQVFWSLAGDYWLPFLKVCDCHLHRELLVCFVEARSGEQLLFFFLCSSIFSYTHTYNNEAFIIICDRANVCLVDLFSPIFLWRKPRTFSYNNVSFRLLLHTLPYSRL